MKNRRMKKYGAVEIWCMSHIHPRDHSTTHLVVRSGYEGLVERVVWVGCVCCEPQRNLLFC
jgi:hypothetical protein